jgi:hypothetical protein
LTVNVTDMVALLLLPYGPDAASVQLRVKVLAPAVVGVTSMLPLVGSLPLQAPVAVQELEFAADQVSVALWPATMVVGCTASEIAGAGAGEDMLLPPP